MEIYDNFTGQNNQVIWNYRLREIIKNIQEKIDKYRCKNKNNINRPE